MALWLLIAAVVLEVIALAIGLRNRSPYRNTPVDDRTRSLLRIAQYVLIAVAGRSRGVCEVPCGRGTTDVRSGVVAARRELDLPDRRGLRAIDEHRRRSGRRHALAGTRRARICSRLADDSDRRGWQQEIPVYLSALRASRPPRFHVPK
jgi:hypothetical protein